MNERKYLKKKLAHLEQQFLTQQRHVEAHTRYLKVWYEEHRVMLMVFVVTASIGSMYASQQLRHSERASSVWRKWGKPGLRALLDLNLIQSAITRGLITKALHS